MILTGQVPANTLGLPAVLSVSFLYVAKEAIMKMKARLLLLFSLIAVNALLLTVRTGQTQQVQYNHCKWACAGSHCAQQCGTNLGDCGTDTCDGTSACGSGC